MDWTERYRPSTLAEVRGNDKARDALHDWAQSWDDHQEAAILYGSPGVGKTSAAHALAKDLGWDVIELNASDQRTRDVIERVAGEAAMSGTLTGGGRGRKLVILDEADNIHYQKDYGGQQAVTELIKKASQPIVLIANDLYDMSRGLQNAGRQIEFRDVSARSILPVLRDICRQEGVDYEDEALEAIAEANSGDLRSAINDLQALAESNEVLTVEDIVTGSRDRTEDIWTFLDAVLKEESAEIALRTAYDVDETPDSLTQWIEDKVPMVYEGKELAAAYGFLANADRWLGRVRASQNYSYWRYVTDNFAAGVASVRDHDRGGWTRYGGPPFRSRSDSTRDHIARKIAQESGVSMTTARRSILPFLAAMTHHCTNRELTVAMAAVYDLDAEHLAFITGSGKTTNKVETIVEDAAELREAAMEEHAGSAFEGMAQFDSTDVSAEPVDEDTEAESAETDSQSGLTDFT